MSDENIRSTRNRKGTVVRQYQPKVKAEKADDERFFMSGGLGDPHDMVESVRSPDSGGGVAVDDDVRGGGMGVRENLTSEGYPHSAFSYDSESLYAGSTGGSVSARAAGGGTASATSLTTGGATGEEEGDAEDGEKLEGGEGEVMEKGTKRQRTIRQSASYAVLSVRRKMGRCST